MNIRLIILIGVLFPFLSFAQHRFKHLNIDDGLSQNTVTDIFQDNEGYMWFATQDGISQYDGYDFKNFNLNKDSSESLSDNYLWSIHEDVAGQIWFCSRDGLNRLNKKTKECTKFYSWDSEGKPGLNQCNDMAFYKGRVCVTINGKFYSMPFSKEYNTTSNFILEQNVGLDTSINIFGFHQDKNGHELYLLTEKGVYNYGEYKLYEVEKFADKTTIGFLESANNGELGFWFTNGSTVYYFDKKLREIKTLEINLEEAVIYNLMLVDEQLWLATNKGIFLIKEDYVVGRIRKNSLNIDGLSSDFISSLFQSKSGKIWVGTSGNGLNLYDPSQNKFNYLSSETFGKKNIIRCMVQDSKNRLLIGGDENFIVDLKNTAFGKAFFAQNEVASVKPFKLTSYPNLSITSIAMSSSDDVLVGAKAGLLLVLDKDLKVKKEISFQSNEASVNMVSDIHITAKGNIWITTFFGIYTLDADYNEIHRFLPQEKGLTTNYFLSVYETKAGQIWLGSNRGIYKYNQTTDNFKQYPYLKNDLSHSPGFNFISEFTDFDDGYLWMTTYGGGLSKMDVKNEKFEHFTQDQGLSNNVCNGLLVDDEGNFWINTNNGISKFDRNSGSFKNYDKSDGLLFDEYNLNSYYKNASGNLLFGTPVGLVVFDPLNIPTDTFEPPILITDIRINYKPALDRINDKNIELYPEDKSITMSFAGLNYSNSRKIRYKYKLEGYNENWIETIERKATYTSLPDGNYVFLINCTNHDGIWNKEPKKINIRVYPPFYKTWWFMLISGLVVFALGVLFVRHFAQRKMKKKLLELRLQQEIHQEKQRISRDLHDNIGAQITYLISSIDQESYLNKEHQGVFDVLSDKARNVMTQLRQTLWVINKEAISVADFALKVQDYSTKVLNAANINSLYENTGRSDKILAPILVSHLFHIIQEAHNNIIKHSGAKHVQVTIFTNSDSLEILIQDDGKGFESPDNLDDHFGLKNMRDRTAEIDGVINFDSSGDGCLVSLSVPI